MNVLTKKFNEVFFAVLPITLIVLVLHFTISPLETHLLLRFLLGAVSIVLGLSIFLIGVDISVTPIGALMGTTLAKSNKVWIVGIGGLALGSFITIAEPVLHVFGGQVASVTSGTISKLSIVFVVAAGIAIMLTVGLFRIVFNRPLHKLLTILYLIILGLGIFASPEFLAISFDAAAATTGVMTIPFVLALALGVSSLKKDGKASEEDSFGLVGIAATGAILTVMITGLISKSDMVSAGPEHQISQSTSVMTPFLKESLTVAGEVFWALLPILALFLFFQFISFKLSKKAFKKIMKGLVYSFIGLVFFLTGVNAGFMDVGSIVGYNLASLNGQWIVVVVGFILGLSVILAEPAVYVLTNQIETVTSGYLKGNVIVFALSIGVAFAVALSILRVIIPAIQLWHFLLPGYIISLAMAHFVPKLFVGIAFDSGGVASGPISATFVLAYAQGAAKAIEGANVLIDGFGVIAMVALTPVIALQVLGLIFKIKSAKGGLRTNEQ